jgi:hypothetical protein
VPVGEIGAHGWGGGGDRWRMATMGRLEWDGLKA